MQLKIQRSQRAGGILGNAVVFCLDVRADYSPEERGNIGKYRLGGQVIYNSQAARRHFEHAGAHLERTQSGGVGERAVGLARGALSMAMAKMSLNISIASLGRGHHIECRDLDELLEAEDTVRTACKGVTRYLDVAATFDGSEMVIEYERGEERIHITEHAPPLIEYQPSDPDVSPLPPPPPPSDAFMEIAREFARLGAMLKKRWLAIQGKLLAFAAAKGWDVRGLHLKAARRAKERWLSIEQRLYAFAAAKGWNVGIPQIRFACGAGALTVLFIVLHVL